MDILVDFDNLPHRFRAKGRVANLVDRVVSLTGARSFRADPNARFRLYGGWYTGDTLTKSAQDLSADLQAGFPKAFILHDSGRPLRIRVQAELAFGLAAEPSRALPNTLRHKVFPHNLRCSDPTTQGCTSRPCALLPVYHLLEHGSCPVPSCSVQGADILSRNEQKLVDTMMAVDLLHHAHRRDSEVGLVTSDDDLWPAIRSACLLGTRVLHFPSRLRTGTPARYSSDIASKFYTERIL